MPWSWGEGLALRDLPSCSLSPGKGRRSEAGSSQLSVMPGGSTPAHQREVSWLTISIATVEEEGAATPIQCICHFWAGLLQFSLCSQEGPRDPLISLVCRAGCGDSLPSTAPGALLRPCFCIRGHFIAEDDSPLLTNMSKAKTNDFMVIRVLRILNANLG